MLKLLKSNLLLLAMVFAVGTAFAFKAEIKNSTAQKWAYDSENEVWVNVDGQSQQTTMGGPGDYRCTLSPLTTCTAVFNVNPNDDDSSPTSIIPGEYEDLP